MRTPTTPLPPRVERWAAWLTRLRWLDALAGALLLWLLLAAALPALTPDVWALLALLLLAALAWVPPLRVRWRPVTAAVGLAVSRRLRPGDHAWYLRPGGAERVLVTGRRGTRIVVAGARRGPGEGLAVRRTRVLLLPLDGDRTAP